MKPTTRTSDFDADLELRVQAELARERTGQNGYTDEQVLRIGRMWYALKNANLSNRIATRLNESLLALFPNQERAIGPDGTFYRLCVYWPTAARRWAALRSGAVGAFGGALFCTLALAIGQATADTWATVVPIGASVLGLLAAWAGWENADTMQRCYEPITPEEVDAHSVELAYDEIRRSLAYCETRREKAEALRRFAEHDATQALAAIR